jgi:PAS domain S-box-containing protein
MQRLAWLPICILLAAMVVLWAADVRGSYGSNFLIMALNFIFSTLASGLIVYLVSRSFLTRGEPGLLMLGCGVLAWGAAGVLAKAVNQGDANLDVTIHNTCVWLSALFHLASALLLLRPRRAVHARELWLGTAYAGALGVMGLVAVAAFHGYTPTFFVQGTGGTLIRQFVLGSAIVMFLSTAVLLRVANRRPLPVFLYWYSLALGMIAIGLLGIMIESVYASLLSWTGLMAQYLSGVYMLIAAIASVRESGAWHISLEVALRESEERLALAASATQIGMFDWNLAKGTVQWTQTHEAIFGYAPAASTATATATTTTEHHYSRWADRVHPEDLPLVEEESRRCMQDRKPLEVQYRIIWPDGSLHWVETRGVFQHESDGKANRMLGVVVDITERKRAEEALRESASEQSRQREFLECVIANAGSCIAVVQGHELRYTMANAAFHSFAPDGPMVGRTYREVFPESAAAGAELLVQCVLETGEPWQVESYQAPVPGKPDATWQGQVVRLPLVAGEEPSALVVVWDITERRRTEEAERASRTKLAAAFASITEAIFIADAGGRLIDFNDEFVRYHRFKDRDECSRTINDCPKYLEAYFADGTPAPIEQWAMPRALRGETASNVEYRLRRKETGETWWGSYSFASFQDKDGGIAGAIVSAREITALKQAEESLQESEERYRTLFETMTEGFSLDEIILDDAGNPVDLRYLSVNPAFERHTGLKAEDIVGRTTRDLFPETEPVWFEQYGKVALTGEPVHFEERFGPLNKWYDVSAYQTEPGRFATVFYDITERKRAAEALKESEERLRLLIDGARDLAIFMLDIDGLVTSWNEGARRLKGWDAQEILGCHFSMFYTKKAIAAGHPEQALKIAAAEGRFEEEGWRVRKDGSMFMAEVVITAIHDDSGKLRGFAKITRDITERKKAEERTVHLASFPQLNPNPILELDSSGSITFFNPATVKVLETLGMGEADIAAFLPPDMNGILESWDRLNEVTLNREIVIKERVFSESIFLTPQFNVARIYAFAITERKQAEEAIKASLHEKDVLLKEVHHRVKNNLQVISSLVSLQASGSKDEAAREVLKDVTYRVRSMALVHEKLYQSNDLARIDFAEYVRSLLNYIWRTHGAAAATIRLTLDLEPVSFPVDTAVPCGLILNELAVNALKHAFQGKADGEVTVSLHSGADGRIRLCMADNGVGLPKGLDWREANSLGLRLVQMLSKQLGAAVDVRSEEGTVFEITFKAKE